MNNISLYKTALIQYVSIIQAKEVALKKYNNIKIVDVETTFTEESKDNVYIFVLFDCIVNNDKNNHQTCYVKVKWDKNMEETI